MLKDKQCYEMQIVSTESVARTSKSISNIGRITGSAWYCRVVQGSAGWCRVVHGSAGSCMVSGQYVCFTSNHNPALKPVIRCIPVNTSVLDPDLYSGALLLIFSQPEKPIQNRLPLPY